MQPQVRIFVILEVRNFVILEVRNPKSATFYEPSGKVLQSTMSRSDRLRVD